MTDNKEKVKQEKKLFPLDYTFQPTLAESVLCVVHSLGVFSGLDYENRGKSATREITHNFNKEN